MPNQACGKCKLNKHPVSSYLVPGSDLMFIGEAPGEQEVKEDRPFVGRAGKLIQAICANLGLDWDSISIANVVKCRPPGNRTPHALEIKCCVPVLWDEIELVKPKLIVMLGETAFCSMFPKMKYTRFNGVFFRRADALYLVTHHPARALHEHNPDIADEIESMILLGLRKVNNITTDIVTMPDTREVLTLDIETFKLKPILIGTLPNITLEGLAVYDKTLLGHYVKFDIRTLRENSIAVSYKDLADTKVLANILYPQFNSNGLKRLSSRLLGIAWWEEDIKTLEMLSDSEIVPPEENVIKYNEQDVFCTARLYAMLSKQLTPEQGELSARICKSIDCLIDIELRGICIDVAVMDRLFTRCDRVLAKLQAIFPDVPFTSAKAMGDILKANVDIPFKYTEKTGRIATDKKSIAKYAQITKHPLLRAIVCHRKWFEARKKLTTLKEHIVYDDLTDNAFIHTTFVPFKDREEVKHEGTSTGRIASARPNLQNLAGSDGTSPINIRRIVVPRDSKYSFMVFDYSQLELRVLAHYSKDPLLLDIYNNSNRDLHQETATMLKIPRNVAKAVNFGIAYGITPHGLIDNLLLQGVKLSLADAEKILDNWYKLYYNVKVYQDELIAQVRRTNKLETLFGLPRYFPNIDKDTTREIINSQIQGTAGQIMTLFAIPDITEYCRHNPTIFPVLTTHDDLVIEGIKSDTHINNIKVIMESYKLLDVPLKVGVKVGNSLGELI